MTLFATDIDRHYLLSSESRNLVVFVLIIALVVAAILMYLRSQGGGTGLTINPVAEKQQPGSATPARVAATTLYLREGPGTQYAATYLLPRNWLVSVLGESRTGDDGEVWVKIRLDTLQGAKEGWVNRKYIRQ
jgi:uncharacterized protein YgiM (DUF1202 family)